MGLDRDTKRRLREMFHREVCCRCGAAATRLARKRFYCDRHFPYLRKSGGDQPYRHPKV
jgi:hypothetical protein